MPAMIAAVALTASLAMSPLDGGSARHPQGHKVSVKVALSEPTVVTGLEVWWGPGVTFRRESVPRCSFALLERRGPTACPSASRVGGGLMWDDAVSPDLPSGGGTRVTFLNGRDRTLIAYVATSLPLRVRAAVPSVVTVGRPGAWPTRDAWTFPPILQKATGVTFTTTDLRFTLGRKNYISTTGCPKGGWRWRVRVRTDAAGVVAADGRVRCRR